MIFKHFRHLFFAGIFAVSVMSCATTENINNTQQEPEKKSTIHQKPVKARPEIDPALAARNLDEIQKYINDLSQWSYIERVIGEYETIDQAINQDSIKILHLVIANNPLTGEYRRGHQPSLRDLQLAVSRYLGAIEFLLKKKADVDLLNDDGENALCAFLKIPAPSRRTSYSSEKLESIVKLFIENGADIKAKDKNGISAFEKIAVFAGIEYIKPLLDSGIDINTALAAAIKGNNMDLINYAIENGASLDTKTEEGKSLFILAAESINDFEIFKKVVDKTTDINAIVVTKKSQSRNALHYIISDLNQQKNQEVNLDKAIYLLKKGVKVFESNWKKQNEDYSMIVTVLKSAGTNFKKHEILCRELIKAGADVNLTDNIQSPLFILIYRLFRYDIEPLFELLIEKGADVNFIFRGKKTPLDLILSGNLRMDSEKLKNRAKMMEIKLRSKGARTFSELQK